MQTQNERAASATAATFTGERRIDATAGQHEVAHDHGHLLAIGFCTGRDVLNVTTGHGYGAATLRARRLPMALISSLRASHLL